MERKRSKSNAAKTVGDGVAQPIEPAADMDEASSHRVLDFPTVGIGASVGGFDALKKFFVV